MQPSTTEWCEQKLLNMWVQLLNTHQSDIKNSLSHKNVQEDSGLAWIWENEKQTMCTHSCPQQHLALWIPVDNPWEAESKFWAKERYYMRFNPLLECNQEHKGRMLRSTIVGQGCPLLMLNSTLVRHLPLRERSPPTDCNHKEKTTQKHQLRRLE